jgi:hypothetical protein
MWSQLFDGFVCYRACTQGFMRALKIFSVWPSRFRRPAEESSQPKNHNKINAGVRRTQGSDLREHLESSSAAQFFGRLHLSIYAFLAFFIFSFSPFWLLALDRSFI